MKNLYIIIITKIMKKKKYFKGYSIIYLIMFSFLLQFKEISHQYITKLRIKKYIYVIGVLLNSALLATSERLYIQENPTTKN